MGVACSIPADLEPGPEPPISTRFGTETTLQMNSDLLRSHRSDFIRPTRNPLFHLEAPPYDGSDNLETSRESSCLPSLLRECSHFLDKSSISHLRCIILLGVFSLALPWTLNAKQYRIDQWSPPWLKYWNVLNYLLLLQTSFLLLFQIYIFFPLLFSQSHSSYRPVFMSSLSVLWYVFGVLYILNLMLYGEDIRQYVNTLLRFYREQVANYLIHLDNYREAMNTMMRVGMATSFVRILASTLLFMAMPFMPWYPYSYVHPKPWYWLIPGAVQTFLLTGQGCTSVLLVSWLVVAHCNTVTFWLTETQLE